MTLHERIIEISKKHGLSHNGSCLTAVGIIDEIYSIKKEDEVFILSSGHAFLALAVVLEKYYGVDSLKARIKDEITGEDLLIAHNFDAEKLYLKHGTHPNRDLEDKIYCSTGSLGMGIICAVGIALANRSKNVYVLMSDGEMMEGSVYEAANVIKKYKVDNLKVCVNFNNYGAYDFIPDSFKETINFLFPNAMIYHTKFEDYGLSGQSSHYIKL